jgi:hypothetical protein
MAAAVQEEVDAVAPAERDVMPLLRLHVRDCPSFLLGSHADVHNADWLRETIISVRSPPQDFVEGLPEGSWVRFFGPTVSNRGIAGPLGLCTRLTPFQLSVSGNSPTALLPLREKATFIGPAFLPRRVLRIDQLASRQPGDEFDFAGIVVGVGAPDLDDGGELDAERDRGKPMTQCLYLTDTSSGVLVVVCHTKVGFAPVVVEGSPLLIENAVFVRIDKQFDMAVCETNDMAVFNPPKRRHLAGALEELLAWQQMATRIINSAKRRVRSLIEGTKR